MSEMVTEQEFVDLFGTIRHEKIKHLLQYIFSQFAPHRVLEMPSSSSGKYHPADESGEGGFLLHAKRTAKIANDLARALALTQYERDILVGSALIHDLFQYTDNPNSVLKREDIQTKTEHPKTLSEAIESLGDKLSHEEHLIAKIIKYHMGQWGPDETPTIWKKIIDNIRRDDLLIILMHLADYIASRRYINVDVKEGI